MTSSAPALEITGSRQFTAWLAEQNASLAFTTYQAGKIFLIGLQPNGKLSVFERTLDRCMGLWAGDRSLYLSTLYQVWRWENVLKPGQIHEGYDAVYVPQLSYITGDLDIHDLAIAPLPASLVNPPPLDPQIVFINTLFSCLATTSDRDSFIPLWKPPFISRLAAEDRCHLNGLALREGKPRYVTSVSQSDIADGWRDKRRDGGCVLDLETGATVARGLSMPHSPRWYRDRLWVLNSGTGEFGCVDPELGQFHAIAFCPGYLRGCAMSGRYAIVGLSQPRANKTFADLPLAEKLQAKDAEPRCGLWVIDLDTGDIVHWLRVEGIVEELYDVAVLPGIRRPMAIGFRTDQIRRFVSIGDVAELS